MKTVYILMGVIGAGKSTFAKQLANKTQAVVLSSDELRKEFIKKGTIPKEYDTKYNYIVFDELHKQIDENLMKGLSVIVDSTNVPADVRRPIIEIAKKNKAKIHGVVLLLDDEECVRRVVLRQTNDKNSHIIANPVEALAIYKERLNKGMPTLEEGFHQIDTYNNGELVSSKSRVMIATSNAGKIAIYGDIFESLSIPYCSLRDIDIKLDIDENGSDEMENAKIKAIAYHKESGLPVLANDSGLYIHNLPDDCQPGLFVRRYGFHELSDQEMLEEYIKLLKAHGGDSEAHYNVGLAIIDEKGNTFTKMFQPARYFVTTPSPILQKGVPLSSLSYDKKSGKYMSEMTAHEKNEYEGEAMKAQAEFIKSHFSKSVKNEICEC